MRKGILVGIIVAVLLVALLSAYLISTDPETVLITTADATEIALDVEIADEPSEQARGLMFRESLDSDAGMLFVFPDERRRTFWMRDTSIPLSIAYIGADGTIIDIQDLQPLDETPVPSSGPAKYALEVNQGFFDERGIAVGDTVSLE